MTAGWAIQDGVVTHAGSSTGFARLAGGLGIIGGALIVVGGLVFLISYCLRASKASSARRMEVLDRALDHPDLDRETREQLVSLLAREHSSRLAFLGQMSFWLSACFVIGWLLLVFNGAAAVLCQLQVLSVPIVAPLVTAACGLALVTLPTAVREFWARGQRAPHPR